MLPRPVLVLSALLVLAPAPVLASDVCYSSSDSCEARMINKASLTRDRALGVSGSPVAAISAWLSGTATATQALPPITSREEARDWLPGGKFVDFEGNLRAEYEGTVPR